MYSNQTLYTSQSATRRHFQQLAKNLTIITLRFLQCPIQKGQCSQRSQHSSYIPTQDISHFTSRWMPQIIEITVMIFLLLGFVMKFSLCHQLVFHILVCHSNSDDLGARGRYSVLTVMLVLQFLYIFVSLQRCCSSVFFVCVRCCEERSGYVIKTLLYTCVLSSLLWCQVPLCGTDATLLSSF